MSTGLTYITIFDGSASAPDYNTSPVVFSDYDEAMNFSEWTVRNRNQASSQVNIFVWTAGPGQNGQWFIYQGEPAFVAVN